jgi:hypothetical protein
MWFIIKSVSDLDILLLLLCLRSFTPLRRTYAGVTQLRDELDLHQGGFSLHKLMYIDAIQLSFHSSTPLSTHSILSVPRSLYLYYVMHFVIYRLPKYIWPNGRIFNIRTKCISNLLENISNALDYIYKLMTPHIPYDERHG